MSDCEHKKLKCRKCMRNGDLIFFNTEAALLDSANSENLVKYFEDLRSYMHRLGYVEKPIEEDEDATDG